MKRPDKKRLVLTTTKLRALTPIDLRTVPGASGCYGGCNHITDGCPAK